MRVKRVLSGIDTFLTDTLMQGNNLKNLNLKKVGDSRGGYNLIIDAFN